MIVVGEIDNYDNEEVVKYANLKELLDKNNLVMNTTKDERLIYGVERGKDILLSRIEEKELKEEGDYYFNLVKEIMRTLVKWNGSSLFSFEVMEAEEEEGEILSNLLRENLQVEILRNYSHLQEQDLAEFERRYTRLMIARGKINDDILEIVNRAYRLGYVPIPTDDPTKPYEFVKYNQKEQK